VKLPRSTLQAFSQLHPPRTPRRRRFLFDKFHVMKATSAKRSTRFAKAEYARLEGKHRHFYQGAFIVGSRLGKELKISMTTPCADFFPVPSDLVCALLLPSIILVLVLRGVCSLHEGRVIMSELLRLPRIYPLAYLIGWSGTPVGVDLPGPTLSILDRSRLCAQDDAILCGRVLLTSPHWLRGRNTSSWADVRFS